MLSPIIMVDLAVPQRRRSRTGTWLSGDSAPALRDCALKCWPGGSAAVPVLADALPETAPTFMRPPSHAKASLSGYGAQVTAAAEFAARQQQPTSNVSYAYKTRIAATGGGHLGPQPPRDPV